MEETNESNIKEVFDYYDQDKDGFINLKVLPSALRSLGVNPSESEIHELLIDTGLEESDRIKFDDYSFMAKKLLEVKVPKDELLKAFTELDTSNEGKIEKGEFVRIMSNLGDPLTEEEINEILHVADPNNEGFFDYKAFVNSQF